MVGSVATPHVPFSFIYAEALELLSGLPYMSRVGDNSYKAVQYFIHLKLHTPYLFSFFYCTATSGGADLLQVRLNSRT